MPTTNRVVQDRRWLSRVSALIECEFGFEGIPHKAVIVDLSLNGAFLSAKVLPPNGSALRISLRSPHLKKPLELGGRVVRGGWGTSEHGKLSRFGVQFNGVSPELIGLLKGLTSKAADSASTEP